MESERVFAHCDGMDGPVVKAAQKALETGNVNLVLVWVSKQDESKIKKAFNETLTVRKLSPEAKKLADMYFFETLVRIHRESEGAPYSGLKPAGRELPESIRATDKAIETGEVGPLQKLLTSSVQEGVNKHFKEIVNKKNYKTNDIVAGREFVRSYVEFIHYTKRIYEAAVDSAPGHYNEK